MFERFTEQARAVVVAAREEARRMNHPSIGTEHILVALLSDRAGIAYTVLRDQSGIDQQWVREDIIRLVGSPARQLSAEDAAALRTIGIDLEAVLARVEESLGAAPVPAPEDSPSWRLPFNPRAKKVLELSLRECLRMRHKYIGTEHILLGLCREGEGLAAKILHDAGVNLDAVRSAVEAALKPPA